MTPDLAKIRHIVLDMDGTIYLGGTLFPQTLPFLATLERLGIGYSFVTNNCSRSRSEYINHLHEMGIDAPSDALWTSAHATIFYLHAQHPKAKRLFVLGTPGLCEEFQLAGFEVVDSTPDAVIVGFDTALTYERLAKTAYWISQGLPYIATHPDRICPTDKHTVLPDCGAICALFESATDRRPEAIPGKPSPAMLDPVQRTYNLKPHEIAMVGDRLYTDIRMARDAGVVGVLTLSGETKLAALDECAESDRPDLVISDISELARLIEETRDAQ